MSDSEGSVEDAFVDDIPSLAVQSKKREIFPVNNKVGLLEKLQDYKLSKLDWIEKVDITMKTDEYSTKPGTQSNTQAEDDFEREMSFYNQALASVKKAFKRLKKLGIPTKRPDDFMAEMAKSDEHMVKVGKKLLSKQMVVERVEKVRAIREQKKQGKKIQQEIVQQRKQEKKKMINALKSTKKGKMSADKLLQPHRQPIRGKKGKQNREYRDTKYGYGGKKRGSKFNDAESFAGPESGAGKHGAKGMKFGQRNNKKGNSAPQRMRKHRRRR